MTRPGILKAVKVATLVGGLLFIGMSIGVGIVYNSPSFTNNGNDSNVQDERTNPVYKLYDLTNEQRRIANLNLLDYSPYLSTSAQNKCEDMATRDYWQHESPEGTSPWVFIDATGTKYSYAAENQAYGYSEYADIVNGWMNSQTHRATILNADLEQVGFGICTAPKFQGKTDQIIVVQHFIIP